MPENNIMTKLTEVIFGNLKKNFGLWLRSPQTNRLKRSQGKRFWFLEQLH